MSAINNITDPTALQIIIYSMIIVALLRAFDKTQLSKWLYKQGIPKLYHYFLLVVQDIKKSINSIYSDTDIKLREKPSKISAWGEMIIYSLYSTWFVSTGTAVALLEIMKTANESHASFSNSVILFCVILCFIGHWFRGCAHRVAKENGINLIPWKRNAKNQPA